MTSEKLPLITRSRLRHDLIHLGLMPGDVVMLHVSVKAIGWIVGGPDVVLQSILDILTPQGTLMMYVSWEDEPYELPNWPAERQQAYLAECPPFNPATSRANRRYSILTEYLRTLPGARRSANPGASMAAVGALAEWLTQDHPLQYGFGAGSPLEKLYRVNGKVMLLGAPLERITLLHYAEHRAQVPHKRLARYQMPLLQDGQRVWVDFEEFDAAQGIVQWSGRDYFGLIADDFLSRGQGCYSKVGAARSYLLKAGPLTDFAIAWMEQRFANNQPISGVPGTVGLGSPV